jgi:gamma-glutamyl-gamma-aminobutyrate hydrolase
MGKEQNVRSAAARGGAFAGWLVEAVSVNDHPLRWAQWHPEWNSSEYALSRMLFGFITACQSHIAEKRRL